MNGRSTRASVSPRTPGHRNIHDLRKPRIDSGRPVQLGRAPRRNLPASSGRGRGYGVVGPGSSRGSRHPWALAEAGTDSARYTPAVSSAAHCSVTPVERLSTNPFCSASHPRLNFFSLPGLRRGIFRGIFRGGWWEVPAPVPPNPNQAPRAREVCST